MKYIPTYSNIYLVKQLCFEQLFQYLIILFFQNITSLCLKFKETLHLAQKQNKFFKITLFQRLNT